jgi:hypothetical protein
MPTNITASDINDKLIKNIVTTDTTYFTRADSALVSLASTRGVASSEILSPVTFLVKEWLKAYVGKEVCFNNKGLDNKLLSQENIEIDVYALKLADYQSLFADLNGQITKEVLTGVADTPQEYAYSFGKIYRA